MCPLFHYVRGAQCPARKRTKKKPSIYFRSPVREKAHQDLPNKPGHAAIVLGAVQFGADKADSQREQPNMQSELDALSTSLSGNVADSRRRAKTPQVMFETAMG